MQIIWERYGNWVLCYTNLKLESRHFKLSLTEEDRFMSLDAYRVLACFWAVCLPPQIKLGKLTPNSIQPMNMMWNF